MAFRQTLIKTFENSDLHKYTTLSFCNSLLRLRNIICSVLCFLLNIFRLLRELDLRFMHLGTSGKPAVLLRALIGQLSEVCAMACVFL